MTSRSCPACGQPLQEGAFFSHQRSFLDPAVRRRLGRGLAPRRELLRCGRCFLMLAREPWEDFTRAPMPEALFRPQGPDAREALRYEEAMGARMASFLKEGGEARAGAVLDLRALAGGALQSLREGGVGTSHAGFDLFQSTVDWGRAYRGLDLRRWEPGQPVERWPVAAGGLWEEARWIVSSRPVLELCRDPLAFLRAGAERLAPGAQWLLAERDLASIAPQVFQHELFTPWGNAFFTLGNLVLLARGAGLRVLESRSEHGVAWVRVERAAERSAGGVSAPEPPLPDPLLGRPRIEGLRPHPRWHGQVGAANARLVWAATKVSEQLGGWWELRLKRAFGTTATPHLPAPAVHSGAPWLDVIVTSCGRRKTLERTVRTFKALVTSEERRFRFIAHEDVLAGRERQNEECRKFIAESGLFDRHFFAEANRGIGESIKTLLGAVETDRYFHLEDDMIFLRPLDLDPLLRVMDWQPWVNYIRFYSRHNSADVHCVTKALGDLRSRQYQFAEGVVLTLVPFWSHQANLARTESPFSRLVRGLDGRFRERMVNLRLSRDCATLEDVESQMGTFVYGPVGQARMVYQGSKTSARDLMLKAFPDNFKLRVEDFRRGGPTKRS